MLLQRFRKGCLLFLAWSKLDTKLAFARKNMSHPASRARVHGSTRQNRRGDGKHFEFDVDAAPAGEGGYIRYHAWP